MKLSRLTAFVLGCLIAAPAVAQTLPIPSLVGPSDPSQMNATINNLIRQLNNILQPVISNAPAAVNLISLAGGTTGNAATIGLQTGADTNAGIQINPNGSGAITLFGQTDTGTLKFGNQASFVTAGLANAPGIAAGKAPLGMSDHLRGYILMQDWLGRSYGFPVY